MGIPVPESQFRIQIEGGGIGGAFGILERTTRPTYSVRDFFGRETNYGHSWESAAHAARATETLTVYQNWSSSWAIFSFSQQSQTRQTKTVALDTPKIGEALKKILSNKTCKDFIKGLLEKASSITGRKLAEDGDVLRMFDIAKNNLTRERPKDATTSVGNPVGSFKKGNAGVFVAGDPKIDAKNQLASDVANILHELLHLAAFNGKYFTDKDFAEIIHNSPDASIPFTGEFAAYPVNPFDANLTKDQKKALKDEGNGVWGGYWDRVLTNKCFRDEKGNSINIANLVK
jgi:hypothetical protein